MNKDKNNNYINRKEFCNRVKNDGIIIIQNDEIFKKKKIKSFSTIDLQYDAKAKVFFRF